MLKIKNIENSTTELDKILSTTVRALEGVLSSDLFRKRVMDFDFDVMIDGKKTTLPSSEIYKLTQGNLEIDTLRFYNRDSSIGGMANEELGRIKINTHNFREETTAINADTLIHEYMHLVSFDHDSSQDLDSVPYAIGTIVRMILRKYPYEVGKTKLRQANKGFPLCFLKQWKWI